MPRLKRADSDTRRMRSKRDLGKDDEESVGAMEREGEGEEDGGFRRALVLEFGLEREVEGEGDQSSDEDR
jgi:hypothetical protein